MSKIFTFIVLGMFLLQGCDGTSKSGKTKYGDGEVAGSNLTATQVFDTHEFDGVQVDRGFDVTIAEGNSPRVILTTDDNILTLFTPRIVDGILLLTFSSGFTTSSEIKILIESPNIERINHQGSGTVLLDNLKLKFLEISSTGSGKITGIGSVQKLWVESTGTGNIMLQDMPSKKCDILQSGPGEVVVTATEEISATNKGKGSIYYYGDPETKNLENSDAGIIKRK